MARKKEETQDVASGVTTAAQVDAENTKDSVGTVKSVTSPGDVAKSTENVETHAAIDQNTTKNQDKPKLENLSVLADRHRIPAWQQAALLRYMDWQDDKLVSDEDYKAAMQALKTRRIGGGRR